MGYDYTLVLTLYSRTAEEVADYNCASSIDPADQRRALVRAENRSAVNRRLAGRAPAKKSMAWRPGKGQRSVPGYKGWKTLDDDKNKLAETVHKKFEAGDASDGAATPEGGTDYESLSGSDSDVWDTASSGDEDAYSSADDPVGGPVRSQQRRPTWYLGQISLAKGEDLTDDGRALTAKLNHPESRVRVLILGHGNKESTKIAGYQAKELKHLLGQMGVEFKAKETRISLVSCYSGRRTKSADDAMSSFADTLYSSLSDKQRARTTLSARTGAVKVLGVDKAGDEEMCKCVDQSEAFDRENPNFEYKAPGSKFIWSTEDGQTVVRDPYENNVKISGNRFGPPPSQDAPAEPAKDSPSPA